MSSFSESVIEIGPAEMTPVREVGDHEIVVTEKRSHWIGFNVYRTIGKTESGGRIYNRDGYQSSPDPVEDRSAAQVMLSGSLHFCGRSNMEEFTALLTERAVKSLSTGMSHRGIRFYC